VLKVLDGHPSSHVTWNISGYACRLVRRIRGAYIVIRQANIHILGENPNVCVLNNRGANQLYEAAVNDPWIETELEGNFEGIS
jgi:hypothetical protein